MSHVLIHFKDNYADEFDVFGFCLMPEEDWEWMQEHITDEDVEHFYFGSNEAIYYYSKEEFLSNFWHRPVKDADVKTLKKMFRGISHGFGHWPFKYLDIEWPEKKEEV